MEMRNSSEQPDPKADAVSAANTPTARAVSGVHWGFPVGQRQQAPVDPAEPPAKSSFHQSCDPVLTDNPTFDGDNPAEEPVLTQNPTYEHDSADEDTGFVDCDDSISVSGGSQTGPGSSSGGADDHFAELKYLRPGHEDEDNLLVRCALSLLANTSAWSAGCMLDCVHASCLDSLWAGSFKDTTQACLKTRQCLGHWGHMHTCQSSASDPCKWLQCRWSRHMVAFKASGPSLHLRM